MLGFFCRILNYGDDNRTLFLSQNNKSNVIENYEVKTLISIYQIQGTGLPHCDRGTPN